MEITSNLCSNATRKIGLLITKASDLGMDIGGYGEASENTSSGNVYLWLEDYPFTLYIGLGSDTIYAVWCNSDNGDEVDMQVTSTTRLDDLLQWCDGLGVSGVSV
jgi:hypothetical protein